MSLIRKKKSAIFDEPKKTAYKKKIQEIIDQHKDKLNMNNRSTSKTKPNLTEKLSLLQAKNIESLHLKTARSRRSSLNTLIKDYDRNCIQNVETQFQTIDEEKMKMFKRGVYYRSRQRAAGTGIKKIELDDLKEYLNWNPNHQENNKKQRKPNKTNFIHEKQISRLPAQSHIYSRGGYSTINL